jgi:hypothetical protein
MGSVKAEVYAELLEEALDATIAAAEQVSEGGRLRAAQEGKAHPLWFIGHMAYANNLLLHQWCCDGESMIPSEYNKIFGPDFGGGNPITANADDYPSWDEVLDNYNKVGRACVEGIRALDDATLAGNLRGGAPDSIKEKFKSVQYAVRAMATHDAYHRGQMNAVAALG